MLLLCLSFASTAFAQFEFGNDFECPPGAWCHPGGIPLGATGDLHDPITHAGDAVGKDLNQKVKDSGSDKGIWGAIVDWVRCQYGSGTAQASGCSEAQSYSEAMTQEEKDQISKMKINGFNLNPEFIPAYLNGNKKKMTLRKSLNKMKRGQVVGKLDKGHSMILGYKYYTSKDKTNFTVIFYIQNKNKKTVATRILATEKSEIYIAEPMLAKK